MKRIIYISNKCLLYLFTLQVLNLSFNNLSMPEYSLFGTGTENNQIDSALEYITEHVLGWTNFIPEQHKAHQDKHFIKLASCPLFCERINSPLQALSNNNINTGFVFIPGILSEYYLEINPPPPKTTIIA